jgi:hypothetical protein
MYVPNLIWMHHTPQLQFRMHHTPPARTTPPATAPHAPHTPARTTPPATAPHALHTPIFDCSEVLVVGLLPHHHVCHMHACDARHTAGTPSRPQPAVHAVGHEGPVHVQRRRGVEAALHHHRQRRHVLRCRLPVPLPLVDEPVVDLLLVQPCSLLQRHLLRLLCTHVPYRHYLPLLPHCVGHATKLDGD